MRARAALIAATTLLLAAPAAAPAAITVGNQNDSGPGSLRQALLDAPPGETIVLPAGTYTLTSGPLTVVKSVTISGQGAGSTILRAGGPFRVVETGGPIDVTIAGLTIRDGYIFDSPAVGGGVYNVDASLTLNAVTVTGNTVSANGTAGIAGGLAEGGGVASGGPLRLIDSTVTGNVATAVGGSGKNGGLAEGGGVVAVAALTIVNSTVSNNLADARGGQGPANAGQNGGLAEGGGVVAVQNVPPGASIVGSTISGNLADSSPGPGGSGGTVEGGGIVEVANSAPVTFQNTTLAGNLARNTGPGGVTAFGGGLLAVANATGSVSLTSVTLSGNGIEAPSLPSVVGGNLFASSGASAEPLTFANTIVANGFGASGSENCGGPSPSPEPVTRSAGFNLDSMDQCNFHANGDLVNRDPQLGPLQNNGGLTATMAPAANSPAIDQGSGFGLTTDQRGVVRPIDLPSIPNSTAPGANGADIGAFELQPSNVFTLGKLKRNKKKGTATLVVNLSQPSAGVLSLSGKGLKSQTAAIAGQAAVSLKVLAKGGVRKALRKRGKRKVKINLTYAPTGNAAATQSRTTKLVKKKHRKKHARKHRR